MARARKHDYLRVRESFHGELDSIPHLYTHGQVAEAGHPSVNAYPDFWEPWTPEYQAAPEPDPEPDKKAEA